jgi:hypothetical protein
MNLGYQAYRPYFSTVELLSESQLKIADRVRPHTELHRLSHRSQAFTDTVFNREQAISQQEEMPRRRRIRNI